MPRKPRIDLPNFLYHIIVRGNNKQLVYLEDNDYQRFIEMLKQAKDKYNFKLYAFALMPNHFHLLIKPGQKAGTSKIMQSLNTGFTMYFNRKHKRCGHLYQGRYKSILVEEEVYLLELIRYIHLNPARAGLVGGPLEYTYSSFHYYMDFKENGLIDKDEILERFGKRREAQVVKFGDFILKDIKRKNKIQKCLVENLENHFDFIGSYKFERKVATLIKQAQ